MTDTASTELSPLAAAIAAHGRKVHKFFVNEFFDLGNKELHAIGIRVAVKAEDDAAIVEAHKHAFEVARAAGEAGEAARKDTDLLTDAKTIEALFRTCRRVELDPVNPENLEKAKETIYSAFATPGWMRKTLTTDQIAILLNLYIEVKNREARGRRDLTDEHVERIAALCQEHAGDDIPEGVLADVPRETLTHIVMLLSLKLGEARESVETLLAAREAEASLDEPAPVSSPS